MEQSIQKHVYPEAEQRPQRLNWSLLARIVFMMLVGFAIITEAARAAAHYAPPPYNPFPAYADIFPGQSARAIEARPFSCLMTYNYYHDPRQNRDPFQETCILILNEGVFSRIEANLVQGTISKLTFIVRDNALRLGDLERIMDTSAVHIYDREVYFTSPHNLVVTKTIAYKGQFSLFLPMWSVAFTR
jgi:hypothetical protein